MFASKVSFSPETVKAMNSELDRNKRKQLRREAVIAYIDERPAGTPITMAVLVKVAGFTSVGSGTKFINEMVSDGIISKHLAEGEWTNSWNVESRATYVPKPIKRKKKIKVEVSRKPEAIKLRRKQALDLIQKRPKNSVIRISEFSKAIGMTSYGSVYNFLQKLQTDGYIRREPATGFKSLYTYEVLKRDVMFEAEYAKQQEAKKMSEPDQTPAEEIVAEDNQAVSADEAEKVEELPTTTNPSPLVASTHVESKLDWFDIEMKARKFAWEHNSDSLREFIKWSRN